MSCFQDAYKHVHIHPEDLALQVISFGGKFFVDKAATFGCSSSPHVYDVPAELVLRLSCFAASIPRNLIAKQLDDCICINRKELVDKWCKSYQQTCEKLGVKLAPLDNVKAFAASTSGTLLGVQFDFIEGTWTIAEDKMRKILFLLHDVVDNDTISESKLEKLVGKLTHYFPILGGKHERLVIFIFGLYTSA